MGKHKLFANLQLIWIQIPQRKLGSTVTQRAEGYSHLRTPSMSVLGDLRAQSSGGMKWNWSLTKNIMHQKNIHQGDFNGKSKKLIHIQYEEQSLWCFQTIFSHLTYYHHQHNYTKIKSRSACTVVVSEGNSRGTLGQEMSRLRH